MRSTFFVLLLVLLFSPALSKIVAKLVDKDTVPDNKFDLLCKPCEKFFEEIKKDLPEVSTVSKEVLKSVIDTECDTIDWIPFVDKICDKIGDWAIDKLFDLIVKEDKKIDPNRDCQAIKLC